MGHHPDYTDTRAFSGGEPGEPDDGPNDGCTECDGDGHIECPDCEGEGVADALAACPGCGSETARIDHIEDKAGDPLAVCTACQHPLVMCPTCSDFKLGCIRCPQCSEILAEDEHDGSSVTDKFPGPWSRDKTSENCWTITAANGERVRQVVGDDADDYSARLVAESAAE